MLPASVTCMIWMSPDGVPVALLSRLMLASMVFVHKALPVVSSLPVIVVPE